MLSEMREQVKHIVGDNQYYGIGRVDRIAAMTEKFAKELLSKADYRDRIKEIEYTALLCLTDGPGIYAPQDETCSNALAVMDRFGASQYLKDIVTDNIRHIGYLNRLKGSTPATLPAMIVSDAVMLDEMGLNGILAAVFYAEKYASGENKSLFREDTWPKHTITYAGYVEHPPKSAINVLFERQLHMRAMMMTAPGFEEASKRSVDLIRSLRSYFRENDLMEWNRFLSDYLKEIYITEGC